MSQRDPLKHPTRWLAALGATLALTVATAPVATAAPTVPASLAASSSASVAQSDTAADRFGIDSSPAHAAVDRAINPDDYECGPTDFDVYIDGVIDSLSLVELIFLVNHLEMLDIPTYDALLFGTTADARYNLRLRLPQSLTKTFADVRRFWDIESGDIQLISMHGSVLGDPQRVARILQVDLGRPGFGLSEAAAAQRAQEIAGAVNAGLFAGGNNPLFTLNAFAFTAEGDPDPLVQGVPDKLVFGDGIVDALQALGLGDVGNRAVMGHEFGHHVQFEDNLFDSPLIGPEATRRTELMADAFGTYFSVHARGLALNTKRVLKAEKTFFDVGDCAFDNDGHHGTPNQRLRAATWGADLADTAQPQGFILPSLRFADLFEAKLPELVAPDAA